MVNNNDQKSTFLSLLAETILSYSEPFSTIFNLPKGRLWSIQCFLKLVTTLHGGNENSKGKLALVESLPSKSGFVDGCASVGKLMGGGYRG